MSGKLDQSLDDILKTRRQTNRRSRGRRAPTTGRPATVAPVGGVSKTAKATRGATKPAAPAPATGESKIIVSGLPSDVSEAQIKDYFATTIGPVKKVFLTYGPTGQSRGVSTIVFTQPGSAVKAAEQLNGVKVDGRAMRIEVIVGASQVPPPKGIGERIVVPKGIKKAQPKTVATTAKVATRAATSAGRGGRGRRGGKNAGRGKPKTAEELDAEMTDYFDATATNGAASGANPAVVAGGDTGMEDQIM